MSENTDIEPFEIAQRADEEANGKKSNQKIFQLMINGEMVTLLLPIRWKRMKFAIAMRNGDIWGAFESIWPEVPVMEEDPETGEERPVTEHDIETGEDKPVTETNPEIVKLEDADYTEEEFKLLLERLGETLMGKRRPTRRSSRS